MTQGLRTVLKWLLFESHGTSRCLPYSAKVDHSRHGLGWNPYALNDLIWTFLYTYISFWWNNWLMSQILKDAFYILIVKFLSFQKKGQANPVALHSVLRGDVSRRGALVGEDAVWEPCGQQRNTPKSWRRFWNKCWTAERFLFDYWTCYCVYFDYEIIYYILLRVLFPLPRLPKTRVCSWSRFLFRSGFWFNKNPLKWITDFYPCLSRWQRCNGRRGEAWMFENSWGEFFQVSSGVD